VHLAATLLDVQVDRRLGHVVLHLRGPRLGELRAQVVRRVLLRLLLGGPALAQQGDAGEPGEGGEGSFHVADATVAPASCPVNVPFSPERRRQSGPIQTVGSLTAREVIGTLTTYEVLLMLDPEGAESHQDDLIARVRDLVDRGGGTWRSHDAWGRRRLAYPIAKKNEGIYHLVVFEANAETLDEISRVLKIDDAVLRHMATKHIEGSRTSAPRDETPAPAPAPVAVLEAPEAPEYEAPAEEPVEEEE
jgi:small subunit ribosomal protein S6